MGILRVYSPAGALVDGPVGSDRAPWRPREGLKQGTGTRTAINRLISYLVSRFAWQSAHLALGRDAMLAISVIVCLRLFERTRIRYARRRLFEEFLESLAGVTVNVSYADLGRWRRLARSYFVELYAILLVLTGGFGYCHDLPG